MRKGIVYYTNNLCEERIACAVRRRLVEITENYGLSMVMVAQHQIPHCDCIVLDLNSGVEAMFVQQIAGLTESDADVVFMCEHDVLYHPSHFEMQHAEKSYCFNTNVWTVSAETGDALWYDMPHHTGRRMTSGLFGERSVLLEHFAEKLNRTKADGWTHKKLGYAPGKMDSFPVVTMQSEKPNIDIKHRGNITKGRFKKSQYRSRNRIRNWTLTDAVPGWGKTKTRFNAFLREL